MSPQLNLPRRFDLDWLRVGLIIAVFLFHSGRFFDLGEWHVKNPATYVGMQIWSTLVIVWLMPAIFVISGASIYLAPGAVIAKFVKEKTLRLLVPLVAGIFTHVALQVYLERVSHRQFSGTFLEFLPHYFDGMYGFGGNFAWMGLHLWYLLLLFIYSLVLYPMLDWLKGRGAKLLAGLGNLLARPAVVYLLALPLALAMVKLDPRTPAGMRELGGWPLPCYLLYFLYGFVVVSHGGLWQRIVQQRWTSMLLGLASYAVMVMIWQTYGNPAWGTPERMLISVAFGVGGWSWVLAILGFGGKHLNFNRPVLPYANEAVLPFYVLHQTVLIVLGYFVVQQALPDVLKWLMITLPSFLIIIGLHEIIWRRPWLRFLFGMKVQR